MVVVPGGYGYPWGYGGLGLGGYYGGGYYGGFYDPWDPFGYGGGYAGYGGGYSAYSGGQYRDDDDGAVRIKVKPRDASVYVDGYFVGKVDDFDGLLQKLHLSSGPHRIEIRAPQFESLSFEVLIDTDRTITYHGEMKKMP